MTTKRRFWRKAAWVVWVLGLCGVGAGLAAPAKVEFRCVVCGHQGEEGEQVFNVADPVTQTARSVCARCKELKTICFLCTIPIVENGRDLGDGRLLCARDAQTAVMDAAEAERAATEARQAVERMHARFMTWPKLPVAVVLEDQKEMTRALGRGEGICAYPYLRVMREKRSGPARYEIGLLTGQPRSWLSLETAHALAHIWLHENLPSGRRLATPAVEAFCDLVAWRVAEELGLAQERPRLERSRIPDDQLPLFLEADRTMDFNAVKEWVQYGQGARLVAGEPDRIRTLDAALKPVKPAEVRPLPLVTRGEPATHIALNGIVGTGRKRLALVNDATLAAGEKGRIHLGDGVMEVECVEIRTNSVVLRVLATKEEVELSLKESR